MLDRMKKILHHCINGLAILLLVITSIAYVCVNGIIVTAVINNFRLDTYVGVETGLGIVMLVFFLGWTPAYFLVKYARR